MTSLNEDIYPSNYTYIAKNTLITGDITFNSQVSISGEIEGNIEIKNNYNLTIEPSANIRGKIVSAKIDVFGNISGEIRSNSIVVFHASCVFTGVLNCQRIKIFPGAKLNIKAQTAQ